MNKSEIVFQPEKMKEDSDNGNFQKIENGFKSVKTSMDKLSELLKEQDLSGKDFKEAAGALQEEMGKLNFAINIARRNESNFSEK